MEASQRELGHVLDFLTKLGDDRTVLIGGWAVQAYNPWYGSIDIDLVLRKTSREKLFRHLKTKRGYLDADPGVSGYGGVQQNTKHGRIIIDVFTRDKPQFFEGTKERLDFSALDEVGCVVKSRVEDLDVNVPARHLLLLFKLKAAWDRARRIAEDRSPDPDGEQAKVDKDEADVLALLDPARGAQEIDLEYMARAYERFPFLVDTTRLCYRGAGPAAYEVDARTAEDWVEGFLRRVL